MTLGKLEKRVMDYVWAHLAADEFTVRSVSEALNKKAKNDYAYNTILTVMTHLHEKRLLKRRRKGKTCHYKVRLQEADFIRESSQRFLHQLQKDYGEVAIAHFANVMDEIDPHLLKEAQRLIKEDQHDQQ